MVQGFAYNKRATRAQIQQRVRAQLVLFFGKFRPESTLSDEQRKTVAGERKRFERDLTDLLVDMDARKEAIFSAFTTTMIDVAKEPSTLPMPNPAGIAERVRRRLVPDAGEHACAPCAQGHRVGRDAAKGVVVLRQTGEWLCLRHHEALAWVAHRSNAFSNGLPWHYAPPWYMLVQDEDPVYRWALDYAQRAYGTPPATHCVTLRSEDV